MCQRLTPVRVNAILYSLGIPLREKARRRTTTTELYYPADTE
jgi:hypothetical protein